MDNKLLRCLTLVSLVFVTKIGYAKAPNIKEKKDWTLIVYMSAVNDLHIFAPRNIKQMASIGSNKNINIIVHLDIKDHTGKKTTQRYYVEKNKIVQNTSEQEPLGAMDSGDEDTLISCCKWGITNYPARHYMLDFWNHGMGPIDPVIGRILNPTELFYFNPLTQMLELDRSVGFLDLVYTTRNSLRGICWDDETGNYLTNQKLARGLETICNQYLDGGKFSIIGFDACCMASIEIAHLLAPYADIMVGSQEVELGTGWNYKRVLEPFEHKSLDKHAFAHHIVMQYEQEYATITNDYTQSAIDLKNIELLTENINMVSISLLDAATQQQNNSVTNTIKTSCHKLYCTHFDEPSYKDLGHFYRNLRDNLTNIKLYTHEQTRATINTLEYQLTQGLEIIDNLVFANVAGKNLENAQGVSIYLPARSVHSSYHQIPFAIKNSWLDLLYSIIHS